MLDLFIDYDSANNFIITHLFPYANKEKVSYNLNKIKGINEFRSFDYKDNIYKQYKAVRNSIKRMCIKLWFIKMKNWLCSYQIKVRKWKKKVRVRYTFR